MTIERRDRCRAMLFIAFLIVPRASFAEFSAVCQPFPFKGHVRTVIIEEGTEPLLRMSTRSTTEFSRDGRKSVETSPDVDDPREAELGMFPTTIREYDSARRLISQTDKINGVKKTETITRCQYDDVGRLKFATEKSFNGKVDETYTYAYGPSWRSERRVDAAISVLTTITFDDQERPIRETSVSQYTSPKLTLSSAHDIRYLPDHTETCYETRDGQPDCRTSKYDAHGNFIEQRSSLGISQATYEYDAAGNWIRRVSTFPGMSAHVTKRTITYW